MWSEFKMKQKIKPVVFFAFLVLLLGVTRHYSLADNDEHKEKSWLHDNLNRGDGEGDRDHYRERHHGNDHDGRYLKPVSNSTYEAGCGECHFLYQPELLPSASWMKILDKLDDHFGEEIDLDHDSIKVISEYLKSNGAENSSAKRAVKIMRSIGTHVPLRITAIPYIREKHHELNPDVFKRESIGSLSNCIACHPTAEKGIYEEDTVKIPR
jgi:hypothetical protein